MASTPEGNRAYYLANRERILDKQRSATPEQKASRAKDQRAYRAADPRPTMLSNAIKRAKASGLPCSITVDDIVIPSACPVLGIKLQRNEGGRGPTDCSPTLDRIDGARGYVPGNVVVISLRANRIKNNASPAEILLVGLWQRRVLSEVSQ